MNIQEALRALFGGNTIREKGTKMTYSIIHIKQNDYLVTDYATMAPSVTPNLFLDLNAEYELVSEQ